MSFERSMGLHSICADHTRSSLPLFFVSVSFVSPPTACTESLLVTDHLSIPPTVIKSTSYLCLLTG